MTGGGSLRQKFQQKDKVLNLTEKKAWFKNIFV
jgi:hypothetical protein